MRFLEYLFFKYYYFQVRVGNEDVAPFIAVVFIGFISEFIYADIICFYYYFFQTSSSNAFPKPYSFLIVPTVVILVISYFFLYKKRYKNVLYTYESEWKGKKNLGAILFAVLPIVVFFVETYIKMRMNQGKI